MNADVDKGQWGKIQQRMRAESAGTGSGSHSFKWNGQHTGLRRWHLSKDVKAEIRGSVGV